jgi:hypothetical protein
MVRVPIASLLWPIFFLLSGLSWAGNISGASADANGPHARADHAVSGSIAAGTQITIQNWRQYSQFMPQGMRDLFEGKYFWKIPANVELDVGPTVIHPLPRGYLQATEQRQGQTEITSLPDGRLNIDGYRGGMPFPDPAEPHVGWKILADFWFRYFPHLVVNAPDNLGFSCGLDAYASINCVKGLWGLSPIIIQYRPWRSSRDSRQPG